MEKKQINLQGLFIFDSNGKEISFTPGQFWIEITPPEVFSKIKITDLGSSN